MRTLIVVPTLNESESILALLNRIRIAAPDVEVLVVDDQSPDGTADLAEQAAGRLGQISVLRRTGQPGFAAAYRDGFAWGLARDYDAIGQMDADLSHDPKYLPELQAALESADIVIGSRYVDGGAVVNWGLHRKYLSRAGNRYTAFMLGAGIGDITAGFRLFRADLLELIYRDATHASGYGFQIELAYRALLAGARIDEVPITFVDRELGTSKMSVRIMAEALWLVTRWGTARRLGREPLEGATKNAAPLTRGGVFRN